MNLQNAIKLREQLLSLPGKFDYGNYAYCSLKDLNGKIETFFCPSVIVKHPCETAACVAGWCAILNVPEFSENGYNSSTVEYSRNYLELSYREYQFLFFPSIYESNKIGFIGRDYESMSSYTLEDAIERIDFLLSDRYIPIDDYVKYQED
jgi:hypothetical protein